MIYEFRIVGAALPQPFIALSVENLRAFSGLIGAGMALPERAEHQT